jgi:hypothetical protein
MFLKDFDPSCVSASQRQLILLPSMVCDMLLIITLCGTSPIVLRNLNDTFRKPYLLTSSGVKGRKDSTQLEPLIETSSNGPICVGFYPLLYLMTEASETSYNLNITKTMENAQHNVTRLSDLRRGLG